MAIFAGVRRHHILTGAALGVLMSNSLISQTSDIPLDPQAIVTNAPGERKPDARRKQAKQPALITLAVKDSTISYVIDEIIRQSGAKVIFDRSHKDLKQKVAANISEQSAIDAINSSLARTSLIARHAPDGKAIIIGVRKSGPSQDTMSVSSSASQQGKGTVSGTVVDSSSGKPVQGVAVHLIGGDVRAITDENGVFTLQGVLLGERSISFRLLGYASVQRSVKIAGGSGAVLKVMLRPTATTLGEIVTTATGQQRRVEIPSDIVKINAEQMRERAPVRTVTDMLEAAQVPGVLVTRASGEPGAPTRIRMRGIGSIAQSNDPVIIVDGMWINGTSNAQGSRGIDDIDPETIETIEIVRGPSASTLYGMDAANGVIVITTKKGRAGTTRWNMGYTYDWGSVYGKKPLRYVGIGSPVHEALTTWCSIDRVLSGSCRQDSVMVFDPNHSLVKGEGIEQNHRLNFSVEGGVDAIRYSLTGSSQSQLGARREAPVNLIRMRRVGLKPDQDLVKPSFLDIRSLTSTLLFNPNDKLDIQVVVAGGRRELKNNRYLYNFNGLAGLSSFEASVTTDLRNLSTDTVNFMDEVLSAVMVTPSKNGTVNSNVRLNLGSNWRPGGGIVLSSIAGLDKGIVSTGAYDYGIYCGNLLSACVDTSGNREEQRMESESYTLRLNGSMVLKLGKLGRFMELRPSFGGDYRLTRNSSLLAHQENLPPGEQNMLPQMSTGVIHTTAYNSYSNAAAGWYFNNTVSLFNRLYFDVGFRQDIGSAVRSTTGSRGMPFLGRGLPKIGQSWLLSDEPFWPQNNWVNMLRLRGAVGYAAVQPELTDIRGRYQSGLSYLSNQHFVRTMELRGVPNEKLVPERSGEIEIGIDTDIVYERVSLMITYAHKQNKNSIVTRSLAPSTGVSGGSIKENIARVVNRSLELSTTSRIIDNRSMLLQTDYALTLTDNRVAALGDGVLPFSEASGEGRIVPGYPIGGIWNAQLLGYRDLNNDGIISASELIRSDSSYYLGWSQPRYRASYGVRLTLRGQLSIDSRFAYQSQYIQDHKVDGRLGLESVLAPLHEQALARIASLGGRRSISDLRWNSASVSYHVSAATARRLMARSVSISLQGSNLGLWTNYAGRDPSVNSALLPSARMYGSETSFDDGYTLPRPRLYSFRIQWGL